MAQYATANSGSLPVQLRRAPCPNCPPTQPSATYTISPPPVPNPNLSDTLICTDHTNPITISQGAVPVTFSALSPGDFPGPPNGPYIPFDPQPGTHYFPYQENPGGCDWKDTLLVRVIPPDTPMFSVPTKEYCGFTTNPAPFGIANSALTNVSGTFSSTPSGLGYSPIGGAQIIVDPSNSPPGNYIVTYDPNLSCWATGSAIITITRDSADLSYPNPVCQTDLTVTPSLTSTVALSFSSPTIPASKLNSTTGSVDLDFVTQNSSYEVIATAAAGVCASVPLDTNTLTVTMPVLNSLSYASGQTTFCGHSGGILNPDPGLVAGGRFTSTDSADIDLHPLNGEINLQNTLPGTYHITYTPAQGQCGLPGSVSLTVIKNAATIAYPSGPFCTTADSVGLTAMTGAAGGYFSAVPDAANDRLALDSISGKFAPNQSDPGTYTVYYRFQDGDCDELLDSARITIVPPNPISFNYPQYKFCEDSLVSIAPSGAIGGNQYSIFPVSGTNGTFDPTSGKFNPGQMEPLTYTITYENTGNCPNSTWLEIEVLPRAQPDFYYPGDTISSGHIQLCTGDTTALPLYRTNYTQGSYTYRWDGPPGDSVPLALHPELGVITLGEAAQEGRFTITFLTNDSLCFNRDRAKIEVVRSQNAFFTLERDLVRSPQLTQYCKSDTSHWRIDLKQSSAPINIDPSDGLVIDPNGGSPLIDPQASTPGWYYLERYLSHSNPACEDAYRDSVRIFPVPDFERTDYQFSQEYLCEGIDFALTATYRGSGAVLRDHQFSIDTTKPVDLFDREFSLNDTLPAGEYNFHIRYFDENQCHLDVSLPQTVHASPVPKLFPVDGSRGDPPAWNPDHHNPDTIVVNHPEAFGFWLSSDQNSTEFTFSQSTDENWAQLLIPNDADAPLDEVAESATDPGFLPQRAELTAPLLPIYIDYQFAAESKTCKSDTVTVQIMILPGEGELFIPEAFSPNGDGFNDHWVFLWESTYDYVGKTVELYNRTGHKLFTRSVESMGRTRGFNGFGYPDGVYWYVVRNEIGEPLHKGGLTLKRR
ncbi:MAG: gliding motility-associated C-terminal domain-containing protein [Bacteroidota bacterium]